MDTRVAYWTTDEQGNLLLYNGSSQFIKSVPKSQASSYIAAYSSGNPAATNVGASASSNGDSSGSRGLTAAQQNTQANQQANLSEDQRQFDLTQGERKARGDQEMQLAQAAQSWKQAIETGDRETAEKWRQVAADLDERKFKASLRGPDNYIKYWQDSRPTPGAAPAPATQQQSQVPQWANQPAQAPAAQAPVQSVPAWTQQTTMSPTVADLAAGPTTPTTFTGQNGVPIDFSGSEWMKRQAAQIPTWAK